MDEARRWARRLADCGGVGDGNMGHLLRLGTLRDPRLAQAGVPRCP